MSRLNFATVSAQPPEADWRARYTMFVGFHRNDRPARQARAAPVARRWQPAARQKPTLPRSTSGGLNTPSSARPTTRDLLRRREQCDEVYRRGEDLTIGRPDDARLMRRARRAPPARHTRRHRRGDVSARSFRSPNRRCGPRLYTPARDGNVCCNEERRGSWENLTGASRVPPHYVSASTDRASTRRRSTSRRQSS